MPEPKGYHGFILDTNIFNMLVKGQLTYEMLPKDFLLVVTTSQKTELDAWQPKDQAEAQLKELALSDLRTIPDFELPTRTTVCGITPWGKSIWGSGPFYEKILSRLKEEQTRKGDSHKHDALIGEVALVQKFELLTADQTLAKIIKELGGSVICIKIPKLQIPT